MGLQCKTISTHGHTLQYVSMVAVIIEWSVELMELKLVEERSES